VKEIQDIIQYIAPTLASALRGPFSGVALNFMTTHFVKDGSLDADKSKNAIAELLNDHENLQKIKELDKLFKKEMSNLDIDVFSVEKDNAQNTKDTNSINYNPQIILSSLFFIAYFLMLSALFFVEVSDTLNMHKGENSLMGEMQIMFGVLTAGLGQILSFWFGGLLGKKNK
jgi:hypothetical protein